MAYNRSELGIKYSPKPKKNKQAQVEDSYGQWLDGPRIATIPSSNITMAGVPYPVLGVDDKGNAQMMYPGVNYTFPGERVTEYPMMEAGGEQDSIRVGANAGVGFEGFMGAPGGAPTNIYQGREGDWLSIAEKQNYPNAAVNVSVSDWLWNAGWDFTKGEQKINPKAYILGEYYRKHKKYDSNDWDDRWGWKGRNTTSAKELDSLYEETVDKLPHNEQLILTNLAKDWFYKNRYRNQNDLYGKNPDGSYIRDNYGAISSDYAATWAPRIRAMYPENFMDPPKSRTEAQQRFSLGQKDEIDYNKYYGRQTIPQKQFGGDVRPETRDVQEVMNILSIPGYEASQKEWLKYLRPKKNNSDVIEVIPPSNYFEDSPLSPKDNIPRVEKGGEEKPYVTKKDVATPLPNNARFNPNAQDYRAMPRGVRAAEYGTGAVEPSYPELLAMPVLTPFKGATAAGKVANILVESAQPGLVPSFKKGFTNTVAKNQGNFPRSQKFSVQNYLDRRQHLKDLKKRALVNSKVDVNKYARDLGQTEDLTQRAINHQNTFYRGVDPTIPTTKYTNNAVQDPIDNLPMIQAMKKAGVDMNSEESIGRYMASHVPLERIEYRAGMPHIDGLDALYTSRGFSNYGDMTFRLKKQSDYSKGSYRDWLKNYDKGDPVIQDMSSTPGYWPSSDDLSTPLPRFTRLSDKNSSVFVGERGRKMFDDVKRVGKNEYGRVKAAPLPYEKGGEENAPRNLNDFFFNRNELDNNIVFFNEISKNCSDPNNPGCLGRAMSYYDQYIAPKVGNESHWARHEKAGIFSGTDNPEFGNTADSWELPAVYKKAGIADVYNTFPNKADAEINPHNENLWNKGNWPVGTILSIGAEGRQRAGDMDTPTMNEMHGLAPSNHTVIVAGFDEKTGEPYVNNMGLIQPLSEVNDHVTNVTIPKDVQGKNLRFSELDRSEPLSYSKANINVSGLENVDSYDPDELLPFVDTLKNNKASIANALNFSDEEYNKYAKIAVALTMSESGGGRDDVFRASKRTLGIPVPTYVLDKLGVTGTVGITQISKTNIENLFRDHGKKLNAMGVYEKHRNPNKNFSIWNPDHAAKITMLLLKDNQKHANRNAKVEGNVELTEEEKAFYQWNMPSVLKKGEAWLEENPNMDKYKKALSIVQKDIPSYGLGGGKKGRFKRNIVLPGVSSAVKETTDTPDIKEQAWLDTLSTTGTIKPIREESNSANGVIKPTEEYSAWEGFWDFIQHPAAAIPATIEQLRADLTGKGEASNETPRATFKRHQNKNAIAQAYQWTPAGAIGWLENPVRATEEDINEGLIIAGTGAAGPIINKGVKQGLQVARPIINKGVKQGLQAASKAKVPLSRALDRNITLNPNVPYGIRKPAGRLDAKLTKAGVMPPIEQRITPETLTKYFDLTQRIGVGGANNYGVFAARHPAAVNSRVLKLADHWGAWDNVVPDPKAIKRFADHPRIGVPTYQGGLTSPEVIKSSKGFPVYQGVTNKLGNNEFVPEIHTYVKNINAGRVRKLSPNSRNELLYGDTKLGYKGLDDKSMIQAIDDLADLNSKGFHMDWSGTNMGLEKNMENGRTAIKFFDISTKAKMPGNVWNERVLKNTPFLNKLEQARTNANQMLSQLSSAGYEPNKLKKFIPKLNEHINKKYGKGLTSEVAEPAVVGGLVPTNTRVMGISQFPTGVSPTAPYQGPPPDLFNTGTAIPRVSPHEIDFLKAILGSKNIKP